MNKKILLISGGLLTIIIIISTFFIVNKNSVNEEIVMQDNNENLINNSFLTLMLEQSDGTYQKSTSNTWPSGNYAFNSEMSRCENGGELRWNREEGIVNLLSNKSDACYVYFDLYNVVEISNVEATKKYNSITVTVTTSGGENPVDKYYFSIDGGNSYRESSTPSYTFSNLTMNHEYTIQVYAKDTLGYESNEEVIEVTTDNYVNPVVNSVTATNVTNDSITVSVSATGGTNNIQNYYYSINNGSYQSSSLNTYTFSGLSAGQSYSIKVYVKDTNNVESSEYQITAKTDDTVLLADYIKGLYTSQGSNGIYYHSISLSNATGDNSYRYSGANPNNYVCFGSNATTCPSNNLYRIIGIFDNQVKLIKSTYATSELLGTNGAHLSSYWYFWNNNTNTNIWSESNLNMINLNVNFLETFTQIWQKKIAIHNFKVGGNTPDNIIYYTKGIPQGAYSYEVGPDSNDSTYSAKIGLMYVSDYYYGASPTYWTYPGYTTSDNPGAYGNYGSAYDYRAAVNNNWLYLGIPEWTITRSLSTNAYDIAFRINSTGYVSGDNYVYGNSSAVRPVFYLTSSTTYVSGSGTSADPIRIT